MNLIREQAFILILSPQGRDLGLEGRKAKDLLSEE